MTRSRPHHLQPLSTTARVALVYKSHPDFGYAHGGLGRTATHTARVLRRHGIWAEVWGASSGGQLAERLRRTHANADTRGELRPTHVVISALWLTTAEVEALAFEFPEVSFSLLSHSNVGFLSADPHAIRLLREAADLQLSLSNVSIAGNSKKFTDWATEAWGVPVAWLPNLYHFEESFPRQVSVWHGDAIRLGLPGMNRVLKNFISSAAAAVELAARLRVPVELHVSTGQGGDFRALREMTENVPNLRLVEAGWLSFAAFRRYLRSLHLVLQVSFTESFNMVAADAIAEGVPVVASDAIDWLPRWFQARADEPRDIARVAEYLLRDPKAPHDGREALDDYVERGVVAWTRFLCPLLPTAPTFAATSQLALNG
jgi:hypothetical protein